MNEELYKKVGEYINSVNERIHRSKSQYPELLSEYETFREDIQKYEFYDNPTVEILGYLIRVPDMREVELPIAQIISSFIHRTVQTFDFAESGVMENIVEVYDHINAGPHFSNCNLRRYAIILGLLKMHRDLMEDKDDDLVFCQLVDALVRNAQKKYGEQLPTVTKYGTKDTSVLDRVISRMREAKKAAEEE